MTQLGAILAVCLAAAPVPAGEGGLEVAGPSYRAHVTGGGLDSLQMTDGNTLVRPGGDPVGLVVHRGKSECFPSDTRGSGHVAPGKPATLTHGRFAGLEDAEGTTSVRVDEQSGDLVLSQSVSNAGPGVWGVEWSIGQIPLDFSIIVPGYSGLRLTRTSVARRMDFAYPKTWEAQLVVIEGPGYGFYVWADDPAGRYKRLTVERDRTGWRLTFRTENDAPFDDLTECQSVPWRLNTYEGDWRVPARRYRDWAVAHFHPVPIGEQKPEWVRDMRTMVIMGMDQKQLDSLAARLDPQQTILYVPSWRAAGYDRDYPTYDKPLPPLKPFIDRAHALGFRVMLHVNYFGVDPKNPLYAQFEPYQLRDCFGTHERQWWLWTRAKPEIRFAYINPALKAWRDLFTERMARLCKDYHVDALHLDQTLCIDNDYNGRIDGLTMLEGNVALHRQLREALPEVALSGEGLNEVTYRYEAFAQRHAYGLSHSEGTWDRSRLAMAHPISSYLFRPYTIINGYLGCSPPSRGQLYAAWNEAYEHWGVIPTLKPQGVNLAEPKGFARQFFDEASFWQENRLEIDLDRPWPEEVPFPFRTAEGRPVDRTADGRMVCDGKVISQTVSGVSSLESAGMISGWRAYDQERLLGLDPERWYPVFPDARPKNAFHVSALPDGMIVRSIVPLDDMAVVRTASSLTVVADLVDLLETAKGGSRPFHGSGYEVDAPFSGDDGAVFQREASDRLFAHPPWRAKQTNPTTGKADEHGTGQTFARYKLDLPKATRLTFLVDVALRENAVGQPNSDGVTFRVCVRDGEREKHAEIHQATSTPVPLTLDLSELAGRSVDLELAVDPGPKRSVSFDWAPLDRASNRAGPSVLPGGCRLSARTRG